MSNLTRGGNGIISMLAGAALATMVLVGVLMLQQTRGGWPFSAPLLPAAPMTTMALQGEEDHLHGRVAVEVDSAWVARLGLLAVPVGRDSIGRDLRTVATVVPDEERVSHVHPRVSGWIEEMYVHTTGERVRAGQPLAGIFSQDLYASQVEYLAARERAPETPGSVVLDGARRRLQVLGMTDEEIAAIESQGEARRLVTIISPRGGVVLRRPVTPGTAVDPATELLVIADLSQVWVIAEVPENDIGMVSVGAEAMLDFPASGLAPFMARVDFLYPTLSERTRSLRVRIPVENAAHVLRPGMTGIVRFQSPPREALTVPRDAVVDTGDMQHVFIKTSATGFEPRPVRVGLRLPDRIEVLEGVEEGEEVLASGVFLIDSESRLRGSGAAGLGHAGHGAPAEGEAAEPGMDHGAH